MHCFLPACLSNGSALGLVEARHRKRLVEPWKLRSLQPVIKQKAMDTAQEVTA